MNDKNKITYEQDYEKYYFEYRYKYKNDTCIVNRIRKLKYEKSNLIKRKGKTKAKISKPTESVSLVALLISLLSLAGEVGTSQNVKGGIALFTLVFIVGGIVYRQLNNKKYNKIIRKIDYELNIVDLRIIALKNLLYEKYKVVV